MRLSLGKTTCRSAGAGVLAAVALAGPPSAVDAQAMSLRTLADVDTAGYLTTPGAVGLAVLPQGGFLAGVVSENDEVEFTRFLDGVASAERFSTPTLADEMGFGVDEFGQLSYVVSRSGSYAVGNEISFAPAAVDGFVETPFPAGGPNEAGFPFSYALDQNGLPAIASMASNLRPGPTRRYVWRFNPQTAGWDRNDLSLPTFTGIAEGFGPQSIAFTADNRLAHASIENVFAAQPTLNVLLETPGLGYRELAGVSNINPDAGVSVAASDDGEVAFAFNLSVDFVRVGISDGESTVYENIDFGATTLGQRSLAYDDVGNLALVRTQGGTTSDWEPRPLILSRRGVDGTWTNTPLGIDAFYGELAFGENGELYIGAVIEDKVVLLSDAVDPLLGDMDFNEVIDLDDALAFVQAIESPTAYLEQYGFSPVFKGDFTGDGVFNLSDIEPFVAELGLAGASAEAFFNLVPEPGVGVWGLWGGVVLLSLRRNQVCPVRENTGLRLN